MAEKYYKISPYAYVANNPITTIDPDGRYLFGLFGSTSAERKEARAEKYAAKVGGDVVKGENGRVSVNVVKSAADGGISIRSKTNFGDFSTVTGSIKKWTTANKDQIIGLSKFAQKTGSNLTKAGLIGAAIGSPTVVGSGPGMATAFVGGLITTGGIITESITNAITGDGKKALGDLAIEGTGIVAGRLVNSALPGTPNVSGEIGDALKVGREIIKGSAEDAGKAVAEKVHGD